MRTHLYFKAIFLFGIVFLLIFNFSNCRKKEKTANAKITVTDTLNKPVRNATILLHARDAYPKKGAKDLEQTGTSDASGMAEFVYKLEAVWSIDASIVKGTDTTLFGKGTVRLVMGETVEKTVIMKPY